MDATQRGACGLGVLIFIATLATSIPAVLIGGDNVSAQCLGSYGGISFNYAQWLNIYGWMNIACLGFFLCLASLWLVSPSLEMAVFLFGSIITVLLGLFNLAWFVVGAILFFKEVDGYCPAHQPLHDFALVLFIFQCFGICIGCCASELKKWLQST